MERGSGVAIVVGPDDSSTEEVSPLRDVCLAVARIFREDLEIRLVVQALPPTIIVLPEDVPFDGNADVYTVLIITDTEISETEWRTIEEKLSALFPLFEFWVEILP